MRDRPHKDFKLEWPGGIVPEWARPKSAKGGNNQKRRGKGPRGAGGGKRERLQKVMAQSGYGSRRNIEILIAQGHITINGEPAKLGDSCGPGDKVKLDGKLIHLRYGEALPRVLMYHKPTGEIVTRDDPEKRPTVFDKLPKVNNGRWVSIGRLDFNTEGLLIFTTNGELANRMTHPRFEVEREYAVRVMGELTEEQTKKLLVDGVDIDGELCKFDAIEDRGGEGSNHWYHVVLREGKNREVRRMMEGVGLMVSRLIRVRFGNIALPGFLKRGQTREMEEEQVQELLAFAGMNEAPQSDSEEDAEDEHDNIGNRLSDMPREADDEPDIDDDIGNRVHHGRDSQRVQHEPDGNRIGQPHPAGGNRPPKGQPQQQQQHRRGQGGGKPFAFGKKRGGQGAQQHGKPHGGQQQRKHPGQQGQQGQPQQGHGQGQSGQAAHPPGTGAPNGAQPQGKPGRHRRHKNRNRNRAAGDARAEQAPATNTNHEPV